MPSSSTGEAVLTAYARSLIKFKARQLSRKPGFSRSDEEDIAQELTLHLLAQAHHFDPQRGSANTFAARVIMPAVKMILRDRNRLKRAPGFTAQSLEDAHAHLDEAVVSLREVVTEADLRRRLSTAVNDHGRSELIAAVVEVFQSLPPDLQDLCRRLIDIPAASVAREMGISRRQLRKAIERIRLNFEAAGLKDF